MINSPNNQIIINTSTKTGEHSKSPRRNEAQNNFQKSLIISPPIKVLY